MKSSSKSARALASLAFVSLGACHEAAPPAASTSPAAVAAVATTTTSAVFVDAPDRSARDRTLDAGRHPRETVAFLDLKPGMRVAEIGAGSGYTTELIARAVGPTGTVYMQNVPEWMPYLTDGLKQRFTHDAMKQTHVVQLERSFEDPLPADAKDLDLVVINLIYHDVVNTKTDRGVMNKHVFDALRPGGRYVVIDSSAAPGSGLAATDPLHRIDEQSVKDEVPRAGFRFGAEADFLRNPADKRDWNADPGESEKTGMRGKNDRFVLAFVKP